MKNCFKAIAVGLALVFTGTAAHAMSELVSVSVTPLWPTNSNPGNLLLYEVRVERQGAGLLEIELGSGCLPEGCNVSFTRESIRLVGHDPRFVYFTMAIHAGQPTATDCCAFTVTGKALRETVAYTNAPATALRIGAMPSQLVNAISYPGGDIEIRGLGDTGQTYQIEASTDPINPNWAPVGSCTADGNGRFTFIHEGASTQGPSMRFYRAVKPAPGS